MVSNFSNQKCIDIDSVGKYFFDKASPVLSNISFTVFQNDCIVISGPNGSGKTVLMTILAKLLKPSSGSVHYTNPNSCVGLIFQDANTQILGDTVIEDVSFAPQSKGLPKDIVLTTVENALNYTGLQNKKDHPARNLSGGEKRRLAVAGVLAMDADIIIFDEPFANLDFLGITQVISLIEKLQKAGKTLIILTHELEKILGLANRLLILYEGALVFDGLPIDAIKDKRIEQYGIRNPLHSYKTIEDLVWRKK